MRSPMRKRWAASAETTAPETGTQLAKEPSRSTPMTCAYHHDTEPKTSREVWPDGVILQDTTGGLWLVVGGARLAIRDQATLDALGLDATEVEPISLFSLSLIGRLPHRGTTLREVSSNEVFVVTEGALAPLTEETAAQGRDARIAVVPDGSLSAIRAVLGCLL